MEIINKLEGSKARTLEYFALPESTHHLTYSDGKWNVRQILVHLVDAESVLYDRIKRIISEQPRPVVWAFNQDSWAAHLDYDNFPLETSKQIFTGVREAIIHLVKKYYISHGDLTFIHSGTGLRTLKDEMDKVVWHCENHLNQIQTALDRA
ncbi:MAG: DinB family protein [Saprospiraceae bacterium]